MIQKTLSLLGLLSLLITIVGAQSTYGPGHLPNKAPRLDEKSKTTAIVLEVYATNDLLKVKDEVTNAVTTYKVSSNAEISGDKKQFGKEDLSLKDLTKGHRIKITFYKKAPSVAQEIEVLKPKK